MLYSMSILANWQCRCSLPTGWCALVTYMILHDFPINAIARKYGAFSLTHPLYKLMITKLGLGGPPGKAIKVSSRPFCGANLDMGFRIGCLEVRVWGLMRMQALSGLVVRYPLPNMESDCPLRNHISYAGMLKIWCAFACPTILQSVL